MRRTPARLAFLLLPLVLLGGCTWVKMAPGAASVQVIPAGPVPSGCDKRGEVVVSVLHNIAFYERNTLRVQEELETQARNEGPGIGANTLQPQAPPEAGQQRFNAFLCRAR